MRYFVQKNGISAVNTQIIFFVCFLWSSFDLVMALWPSLNLFSGRMYSKFIQKYGRVELRAKQPKGYGLWPALWMMPHPYELNGLADIVWPQAGEIDIFEGRGQHPGQD